ncbi:MAG: ferritin-like domain-containing protein [Alphaproteobacteria bacterium]
MKGWSLEDIRWDRFDPLRVNPEVLRIVKAAANVEHNGADYGRYLCNVFHDDPAFQQAALTWAHEEVQHGRALARWAGLADPDFDFDTCFQRFRDGFSLTLDATESIRGSRAAELLSRCIVEVGTSSYYSALAEASDEPVLREICQNIAADELRHYKLFYSHLRRYLKQEKISRLRRFMVAARRITETEDDELAYAYYAANGGDAPYSRRRWSKAYLNRAARLYRPRHVERGVAMALKAAGFQPWGRLNRPLARMAYWMMRRKARHGPGAAGDDYIMGMRVA